MPSWYHSGKWRRVGLVVRCREVLGLVVAALDRRVRDLAARSLGGRVEIADLLLRQRDVLLGQLFAARDFLRRALAVAPVPAAERAADEQYDDRDHGHAGQHGAGERQALTARRGSLLGLLAGKSLLAPLLLFLLPAGHGGEM
jgi:hypothetical protein